MNEHAYQDKMDDKHAKDLAVEIIVKQLEDGEVVRGYEDFYMMQDFNESEFDDIGLYSESIADDVLKQWTQVKESGE